MLARAQVHNAAGERCQPGAEAIGNALLANHHLTRLDLSHNQIESRGARVIALGIRQYLGEHWRLRMAVKGSRSRSVGLTCDRPRSASCPLLQDHPPSAIEA